MAVRRKGADRAEVLVYRQGRRPVPFAVILILVLAVLVIAIAVSFVIGRYAIDPWQACGSWRRSSSPWNTPSGSSTRR